MPSQRRSSRRRSLSGEIALRLTQGWFVVALLSLFFLHGNTDDKGSFPFHPNYLFLIGTALIPAAGWVWYFITQERQKEAGKTLQELQALSPDAFEEWVAARFQEVGYSTKVTGTHGSGGDHGIDITAEKAGEKVVVQCKNWKTWKVGEPKLRDLYGAMHDCGADKAYLVTAGLVSQPARDWIAGKPLEIWDGDYLARLSRQMASQTKKSKETALAVELPVADDPHESKVPPIAETVLNKPEDSLPNCPRCSSVLVQRQNKRTGEPFLGCSKFPACRHTQPLAP